MSIIEPVINGLMVGGLYGLFGLGLALAFGVMRIVNIAHGEFVVVAAFLGVTLLAATPLPWAGSPTPSARRATRPRARSALGGSRRRREPARAAWPSHAPCELADTPARPTAPHTGGRG